MDSSTSTARSNEVKVQEDKSLELSDGDCDTSIAELRSVLQLCVDKLKVNFIFKWVFLSLFYFKKIGLAVVNCLPTERTYDGKNANNSLWPDVSTLAESFSLAKSQHNKHEQVTKC